MKRCGGLWDALVNWENLVLAAGKAQRGKRRPWAVQWMRQAYAAREIDWQDIKPRLASWLGHAKHADTRRLVRRVSREWRFSRGGAVSVPGSSRRRLEQQCARLPVGVPQLRLPAPPVHHPRVPARPGLFLTLRALLPLSERSEDRRFF